MNTRHGAIMQKTDTPNQGDKILSPKKVFIRTFGCQMNEYDSDKMLDMLGQERGVVVTQNPEEADVILFNTCSVREKAQEKVFSDLGRIKHLKKSNPDLVIGVGIVRPNSRDVS
jgi:tRNA-2-methylthio-N6-dimethylallyladenosine synthase